MAATLESRIPQIIASLQPRMNELVRRTSSNIAQGATDRAPQRTGELARGYEGRSDGVHALWRYHFTEFGTVHEPARPHLMPAVEAEVPRIYVTGRELLSGL